MLTALVAALALACMPPDGASGATLAQARTQLLAWRLNPPPLFPSHLPASHSGVNVHLYRFNGVEYVIDLGAPDNADCHTLPNPTDWCVQLRRLAGASLEAWLHDPAIYSVRRMRIGNRSVWFFGDGGNAGGWWMAWEEQGRTYGAWAWTDERTALRRLTPFVESLRPLSSTSGCPALGVADTRGSGEPQGKLSPPAAAVLATLRARHRGKRVAAFWNPYPAVGLTDGPREWLNVLGAGLHVGPLGAYHGSVVDGERWLRDFIPRELRTCRAIKLILVGYSQGAQVTGDVYQRDVTQAQKRHIGAVLLFGDPYFNPRDRSVDSGSYDRHRSGALGARRTFGGDRRVRSFCHRDDPVCQAAWHGIVEPQLFVTWGFKQHENYPVDAREIASRL
jgi:hypothetical protein